MPRPLYFEELQVGDRFTSPSRTITETDIVQFADMTGDFNPLHVDHEFAKNTPFKRVIAHGLLGLSWVAGLGSHHPHMSTEAFLGIEQWEFTRPAYIGDHVHVVTTVLALEPSGRKRGRVTWQRELINQKDEIVQRGRFITLVKLKQQALHRVDAPTSSVPGPHAPITSRS